MRMAAMLEMMRIAAMMPRARVISLPFTVTILWFDGLGGVSWRR